MIRPAKSRYKATCGPGACAHRYGLVVQRSRMARAKALGTSDAQVADSSHANTRSATAPSVDSNVETTEKGGASQRAMCLLR